MKAVGQSDLMSVGVPAETAKALSGALLAVSSVTAAGTVIGDAAAINSELCTVSGASNAGVQLPAAPIGTVITLFNSGANTLKVWPQAADAIFTGANTTGTAAANVTIATAKTQIYFKVGTTTGAWRYTAVD